jgi:chemotaxis protein MotB
MARKKASGGGGPGSGDWLNTYADMVTLLLTFFILLFSMSRMDSAKFNMIVRAFASSGRSDAQITIDGEATNQEEFTGQTPTPQEAITEEIAEIVEAISEMIEQQQLQQSVEVTQAGNDVFIRFMDDMLFEPNSSVLWPEHREILGFVGQSIASIQSKAKMIAVYGHTASVPGNPDYAVNDWVLSSERSTTVIRFLEEESGINPVRMQTLNLGKNMPIAGNETEEGRRQNRRIEIHISTETSITEQLENLYEQLMP